MLMIILLDSSTVIVSNNPKLAKTLERIQADPVRLIEGKNHPYPVYSQ
jgi:hypothetical protein